MIKQIVTYKANVYADRNFFLSGCEVQHTRAMLHAAFTPL